MQPFHGLDLDDHVALDHEQVEPMVRKISAAPVVDWSTCFSALEASPPTRSSIGIPRCVNRLDCKPGPSSRWTVRQQPMIRRAQVFEFVGSGRGDA